MHIFVSNYEGQCNYAAIYYDLKRRSSSFKPYLVFPILMQDGSNEIFSNSTGRWLQLQKRRKIPVYNSDPDTKQNQQNQNKNKIINNQQLKFLVD